MNKLTQSARTTRDFVSKHRVALAVAATTIVMVRINQRNMTQYNDFLKEHGLYEAFYTTVD